MSVCLYAKWYNINISTLSLINDTECSHRSLFNMVSLYRVDPRSGEIEEEAVAHEGNKVSEYKFLVKF